MMIKHAVPLPPPKFRIGVDSGGTFTDVTVMDENSGEMFIWKVSSTPADPSIGIIESIRQILAEIVPQGSHAEVVYFAHGTTVATNALIQGTGALTGVITTAGFRDVLELRRQRRPSLYDLHGDKPHLLAKRNHRLEVKERVLWDGSVETRLDEDDVRQAVKKLKTEKVEAVAVCFLFSFVKPEHEMLVKSVLAEEFPEAFVSISHEVAPEYREYERLSTVVVNAYVGPIIKSYLRQLRQRLESVSIHVPPHLTQSNGGVISFDVAAKFPARTVLSGPAAGVVAALEIARLSKESHIITFDMGGTSTDVALIHDGRPSIANELEVHGYPLKLPMLDIKTVGAGGGSIAYEDHGLLKVGPRSAGAVPGPACYGLGTTEPTVTDANVVLQLLNSEYLLNGRMKIDAAASHAAVEALGRKCKLSKMRTAQGIIDVVIANMVKAIRVISIERGYDPRDYALMAFGGAGPIHAGRLARELGTRAILIPKHPGTLCSLGLLLSDLKTNYSASRLVLLDNDACSVLQDVVTDLERQAALWFEEEHIEASQRLVRRSMDMRYAGQSHELSVECPPGDITAATIHLLKSRFEAIFKQVYGYLAEEERIQVVTCRLEATGIVPKAALPAEEPASTPVEDALTGSREVYLDEINGFVKCPIYWRDKLRPGHTVTGPCIVDQMDTTTLILPNQVATVDRYLTLAVTEVQ
ncbi:MAG: hydantoinase/oxoprolinase family protein [Janthinobacterium lividum]